MLYIAPHIVLHEREVEFSAIRAQGAGGQNINKVSNAIHLRFNIQASSLPDEIKRRLQSLQDHRITRDGVIIIKSQEFRHLEKNRTEALRRLKLLIQNAAIVPKERVATRPSRKARETRRADKAKRSDIKALRGKIIS